MKIVSIYIGLLYIQWAMCDPRQWIIIEDVGLENEYFEARLVENSENSSNGQ